MTILIWLTEGTWQASVDAAAQVAPPDAQISLLHVIDPQVAETLHGAYAGLIGRAGHGTDPGDTVETAARAAQQHLFDAATRRLGRPATRIARTGRIEREVVAAPAGAALLVVARDGDHTRLGPRSLAPPTRFVIDHAPCPVLLIWPDQPPPLATIPPPSHPHPGPPHPGRT